MTLGEEKLEKICSLKKGKNVVQSEIPISDYLPLINMESVKGVINTWADSHNAVTCVEEDVLMLWDGERSGFVTIGQRGVVGSTFSKLEILEKEKIYNIYLFYFLQNKFEWIQNRRTGTGVPHVPKDLKTELCIVYPTNFSEQKKIASILSTIDKNIELTEQIITKQKNVKTGLMHDLLSYGIDEKGQIRSPQTHRFVEKNGIVVPEEWEVEEVGSIASVSGGKRLPKGKIYSHNLTGYRYLRVTDFYKKEINYHLLENISVDIYDILKRYEIKRNELFISIAGSIGYVGVLKPDIADQIILTENALKISLLESSLLAEYIANQMNFNSVQKQIWSGIGTGGGVPKLAMHRVKSLKVPIAPPNEQTKIVTILDKQDQIISEQEIKLEKLKSIKKGLMEDLLTGKVRVNY